METKPKPKTRICAATDCEATISNYMPFCREHMAVKP